MLSIKELRAGYGAVDVVHGVSFSVDPGQVLSILGPNGAGKSTVARCIAGLGKVTAGTVEVDGDLVTKERPERRVARGLALVPENRCLFPNLTVRDNLLLGSYRRNTRARAETLEAVEDMFPRLRERFTQEAGSLSGGEQQMLAIGRALMSDPRYLVLDEPSLGLAPIIVSAILAKVRELAQNGLGIVLVEQNATKALEIADHAVVLDRGRVMLDGPAEQLRQDDRIVSSYLGQAV